MAEITSKTGQVLSIIEDDNATHYFFDRTLFYTYEKDEKLQTRTGKWMVGEERILYSFSDDDKGKWYEVSNKKETKLVYDWLAEKTLLE